MEKGLNKGASSGIFKNAVELRKIQTSAESLLWKELRNRKLNGHKFRRQHPIGNYILDFYCHEEKLGIEVDGEIHLQDENQVYDLHRTKELEELGIKIIRFNNSEILYSLDEVKKIISANLT